MTVDTPTHEPALRANPFVCPHCGVIAQQQWRDGGFPAGASGMRDPNLMRATCLSCKKHSYWVGEEMAWPRHRIGAPAGDDFPEDLKSLYEEARVVAPISPNSAAGLLRLLVEKLSAALGAPEYEHLKDRIKWLKDKHGISADMVTAMEAVRLSGNEALHAGQIDPEHGDDQGVVELLFQIVNWIVLTGFTIPKQSEGLRAEMDRRRQERSRRNAEAKKAAKQNSGPVTRSAPTSVS